MGRGKSAPKLHFYDDFKNSLDVIEGAVYRIIPRAIKDVDTTMHLSRAECTFLGFGGKGGDLLFFYDNIYKSQTAYRVMDFCAKTYTAERYDNGTPDYKLKLLRMPESGA